MDAKTLPTTYARALLELAAERRELEGVREEIEALQGCLREAPDVRLFLQSPRIVQSEKVAVLERALRGRLSELLLHFILMTVAKRRESLLPEILREFVALHDRRLGIVRTRVTTAVPVDEEAAERFRAWIEKCLGKRVVLERKVDEGILGGFVVRYDGMVVDATLKTALDEIRARMRSHKFGSELVHENQS